MKYLKRFNENKEGFYTEINQSEYDTMLKDINHSSFTPYEKSRMKDEFDTWGNRIEIEYFLGDDSKYKEPSNLYEYERVLPGFKVKLNFGGRIFGKEVNIVKLEDGWYLLDIIPRDAPNFATRNNRTYESYRKYYKCDQFDGLLHFLNEKIKEVKKLR